MSPDDDAPTRNKTRLGTRPPENAPPTLVDAVSRPVGTAQDVVGTTMDRYRIDGVLGRGGMGEVLSARDEQIGRSVAIKRLRDDEPSEEVLVRFMREARIQGRLEHPAVVPVHELRYEASGRPFFVMKQLTGVTLADVLSRLEDGDPEAVATYPRQRLLRAFAEVCLAIEFAHTRGVVHRDLKPANIVLGDFGEVYVLDWGIARVSEDERDRGSFADIDTVVGTETVAGSILGTPGYIGPEQIRGDADLDGRADVYALGCILYELLTLQPLHPRGQPAIASALVGTDARASVRAPEREIPPELDTTCVLATAVERADRFATARQLGDAVQRYLDGNRDVALREQLARTELQVARASLSAGPGSDQRRDALRAAARALALAPTNSEAAELVGSLMLEPPPQMPPEVEHELETQELTELRTSARFGTLSAIAYLVFFPVLYWIGFRDTWYMIAGPAVCVFVIIVEVFVAPHNAFWSGYLAIACNLLMFALIAWMVSPVIIGSGPAILMVTLLVTHRRLIRPWLLAALAVTATLSPWWLELAGVVSATTAVRGSDIILHTAAGTLDPSSTLFGVMFYMAVLVVLTTLLSRMQDDERREGRRRLQIQSWQLRQMVPRV